MRLLNVHNLEFHKFLPTDIPDYVVASHRWDEASETTFKDVAKKRNTHKSGYKKVEDYAAFIERNVTAVDWLWIDTCCVNQDSSQEVSEAVNSMFRWYSNAALCIAFLGDVTLEHENREFRQSSWFRRGWTLQELIAPPCVVFVTKSWQIIGHKGDKAGRLGRSLLKGPALDTTIVEITGIPEVVFCHGWLRNEYDAEEIFRWTLGRETTREEDLSYCLFGLFDVSLPVIYGEGRDKARNRLMTEIGRNVETVNTASSHTPTNIQTKRQVDYSCLEGIGHFTSKQALDQHFHDSHIRRTAFECGDCDRTFNTQQSLDQHINSSRAHTSSLNCDRCTRWFSSRIALEQHLSSSSAHMSSFECHDCTRSFGSRQALEQHHYNSPAHRAGFGCKACDRTFSSLQALQQHLDDSPGHVFDRFVRDRWGSRENFQASYGLMMTPDDMEEGDDILKAMVT